MIQAARNPPVAGRFSWIAYLEKAAMRLLDFPLGLMGLTACLVLGMPGLTAARPIETAVLDDLMQDALKVWKVPGVAVAIVYQDRIVYCKGFGVRQVGKPARVTPDTVFPLASCTKMFTTTAMAMLVDEGKMHWDDPVRKHVPFFRLADPLADAGVTLRDLVCHRTGLNGHDLVWYHSGRSQEDIIRRAGRLQLSQPFRTTFQYQSIMVMAAGYAVGKASGQPWEAFVRQRLFGPLGMARSSCTTTVALRDPNHASGHRRNRHGNVEAVPWYPQTVPDPSGSINASARDLTRWLQFQLKGGTYQGKRLVSAKNLEETHRPHTVMRLEGSLRAMQPLTVQMSYGLGWVVQDYRGHRLLSHGGAIDGFRAHITLAPDDRLGIVLVNNLQGTWMNLALSNSIIDVVLGLEPRDWNTVIGDAAHMDEAADREARRRREQSRRQGTKPSLPLTAYAGSYDDPAYGTARIWLDRGQLRWKWSGFGGTLGHFHYDTFTAPQDLLGDPLMVFRLGKEGEVKGMRFLDREFVRKKR
jgi:CubicO group peptidase (beta-lactamase class C family)